jgi:4-hydroxy-4-methyl-2-oxoglutarate aldolase
MPALPPHELLALKRLDTPTIINALELCTTRSPLEGINVEETRDLMPELGPMVGYAVTAEYCATRPAGPSAPAVFEKLLRMIEGSTRPSILVIRDIDSPGRILGAPLGECSANFYRALGAVGCIMDGAARDVAGMWNAGFHVLARRLCVSHALGHFVAAGGRVEVFGTPVHPGDLIHADMHGFVTIPPESAGRLAEAAAHVNHCELEHVIAPARQPGLTADRLLECFVDFQRAVESRDFKGSGSGEWGRGGKDDAGKNTR